MAQTQATSGAARRQCAAILFSSWATTGPQTSENEGQYRPSAASQGPVESTPAMSLTYLSRMRSRVRAPSSLRVSLAYIMRNVAYRQIGPWQNIDTKVLLRRT